MSDPVLNAEPNGNQGVVRAGGSDDLASAVFRRLNSEGRWAELEPTKDAMIRECRKQGMSREDAKVWAWSELDRLYPALKPQVQEAQQVSDGDNFESAAEGDEGLARARVRGIPDDWPDLPPNASLQAEIAWVQANRLDVVDGDRIRLDRAKEPAPSRAALGWLETSIRSYAKYVEVAAKATATAVDEQDMVRRERMAIDEIRELLREMLK